MSDRVVVVHKRKWFGWKVGLLKFLIGGLVIAFTLNRYYPDLDIPYVPGIVCANGAALPSPDGGAKRAGGREGAAYAAGRVARDLSAGPPTPAAVQATWTRLAREAGATVGGFTAAWKGGPAPLEEPKTPKSVPVGSCTPCPNALPAQSGTDGVETAARAALRAGWTGDDAVTAVAIAGAESGWRHDAANTSSSARGMWQTMMSYHAPKYRGASWRDPYANARVAHRIWADAGGWSPWTVYTSGAYREHLGEARTAVEDLTGDGGGTVQAVSVSPGSGLRPVAQRAQAFVRQQLGFTGAIGGYAKSGHMVGSKHYSGLALDVMVNDRRGLGDRVAAYFAGPGRKAFGVDNVIWQRQITNSGRDWRWGSYSGASPHTDHVHVDFKDGATGVGAPVADCGGKVLAASSVSKATKGREFALASFNVLGASHTGSASADARLPRAVRALGRHGVDVVGFQELQARQARGFDRATGGTFARFSARGDTDNSIAWRRSVFAGPTATRLVPVPYFEGKRRLMPAVRLVHRATGRPMWFLNVHNPADTPRHPRQGRWRAEAVRTEVRFVRGLPGPVYWTGDLNARTGFVSAVRRAGLVPATRNGIDHIVGGPGQRFTSRTVDRGRLVDAATDHPLVVARVPVPIGLAG